MVHPGVSTPLRKAGGHPPHKTFPVIAIKGRGTALLPPSRFDAERREAVDDGWGGVDEGSGHADEGRGSLDAGCGPDARFEEATPGSAVSKGSAARPATEVTIEIARSIITRNRSPDIFFDLSINPYRGCEHGCIYCYARPNHAYVGFSPGLDFETRLVAKVNAPELLQRALSSPAYRCEPINVGSVTDAYQPIERDFRLTRRLIEVMAEYRQPLTVITKSSLVERDIDLLAGLARDGLAAVTITVTTLEADLARRMEPRAGAPWRRIETIRRLASAGIPVSVSIGPLIPFINDNEIESLLEAARAAGALSAFYTVVRLPHEVAPLFRQWLEAHFPERAARVMARIQDIRGGRDNDPDFFSRMRGRGVYADLIRMRFTQACRRLGLDHARPDLRVDAFRRPPGYSRPMSGSSPVHKAPEAVQLSLI